MNKLKKLTVILLFLTSFAACKSKDEKSAESVASAREQVVDKQEKVAVKEEQVGQAKVELDQARADFIQAVDDRLQNLDVSITSAKSNAAIDQNRITMLRAEAIALRMQVADEARPFVEQARITFDRIVKDLDAELARK